MADEFDWRPVAPHRRRFSVLSAFVVGLSLLTGFAIGSRYPLSRLVGAIERNGVPHELRGRQVAATSSPETQEFPPFDTQHAKTHSAATPERVAPVLINPGTAEPPKPLDTQPNPEKTRPITAAPLPPRIGPPMRTAPKGGDRKVLVVVRRVGPPYDTKVLRGHIHGSRLVVDGRDRRGITIR